MTLGLLDLSIVTDRLIRQLRAFKDTSRLWAEDEVTPAPSHIQITGQAPDVVRTMPGCQLTIYLFHVAIDKFHRNTYPTGGSAQRVPQQPLSLALYFLVTAHSDSNEKAFVDEQQAMSIALKFFHDNPRVVVHVPLGEREESLTISFEPQSIDEIGRLWQAIGGPLRLSAVYRAAVAILEPAEPAAPKPVLATPEPAAVPHETIAPATPPFAVDANGQARITHADFVSPTRTGLVFGVTTVELRALALEETARAPLARGELLVVDPTELWVRVPEHAPAGRYLLHVHAAPDQPTWEFTLELP